ncbi:MAG: DNA alkylation repair protein [Bdellovibrionota bacterium]
MTKETLKKYHQELKSILDKQPKPPRETIAYIARYIGGVDHEKRKPDEQSQLVYLGVGTEAKRAADKIGFSFSKLSQDEQAEIWNYIWYNSNTFEEKWYALNFFNKKSTLKVITKYWDLLKIWVADVDNWAHSDTLSGIYATVLESDHKKYLPYFRKLNKSKNPWERRQSIVGLYFYTRLRKKTLPAKIGLEFVENLIDDKHIYIQKGVGWTLREIYQVDENAQLAFVKKNIKRIAPAAYYATVEKYPAKLKAEVKILRMKK